MTHSTGEIPVLNRKLSLQQSSQLGKRGRKTKSRATAAHGITAEVKTGLLSREIKLIAYPREAPSQHCVTDESAKLASESEVLIRSH